MASEIGWGLVGAGRHAGNRIAPAIVATPNARLVGVVGRESGRGGGVRGALRGAAVPVAKRAPG